MSESNREEQGRPEWYERLRADGEFPGRTFTADQMTSIERRAASRVTGSKQRALRIGAIACVMTLALVFVVIGQYGSIGEKGQSPAVASPEPVPTASTTPTETAQPVSFLRGPVHVLTEPAAHSGIAFEANGTTQYVLGASYGEYIQVTGEQGTGWIPRWYVEGQFDSIAVEPATTPYFIVNRPVSYRMYPDQPVPTGFELWTGKVVRIVNRYKDWVDVQVMTYDSAYSDNKWVREDELIPYDESRAREGYVTVDTTLYDEGRQTDRTLLKGEPVYVQEEDGERYLILAAGGISGYIDKSCFRQNPFIVSEGTSTLLKGPVGVLPQPQPFANFHVFEANGTDPYSVVDAHADYVRIADHNGNAGWIPAWYLVDEGDPGDRIESVAEPYPMIVGKPVAYRLYPDEPTPSGFELWAGKVVNVIRTFGDDWLEIQVVTYDSPYMENKWVRKDELIPYEDGKAKEGLVYPSRQTVTLYDENGEAQQELPALTPVYIEGEQGDRYRVTAGGGMNGYMNKEDFLPNPFSLKVIDQSNIEELGL